MADLLSGCYKAMARPASVQVQLYHLSRCLTMPKCSGCDGIVKTQLSCPTCLKLGLPPTIFCSQDCFKANWNAHKIFHKAVRQFISTATGPTEGYNSLKCGVKPDDVSTWGKDKSLSRFQSYQFTGTLRPWPQTEMRRVPDHILKPDYWATGVSNDEMRATHKIEIRTPDEIKILRQVCRLGREALDLAHSMIKPGIRGDTIDEAVHNFIIENSAYPSPLNYSGFPKSCCISVNEVICHGIPDLRPFEEGDIVNVDITVYKDGFHGDLNETFYCGQVDDESQKLVKGAYECLMKSIAEVRPGVMYRDLGNTISKIAENQGLSVVRAYCGHGIGKLFHTAPSVPHYRRNKAIGVMKPGHVFTIEPMINAGHWKDETWPDDWTSVTTDGKRSAQFEHTLLVTETGVEILTARLSTSPPLEVDVLPEMEYFKKENME